MVQNFNKKDIEKYQTSRISEEKLYTNKPFLEGIAVNNNGYDSSDDIENQQLINITKLSISDASENHSETKVFSTKKIDTSDKNAFYENLSKYRLLNSLSIFILLTTFFIISFSKIHSSTYFFIVEHLANSKIQSESNLLILNMAFCIVIGIYFFHIYLYSINI